MTTEKQIESNRRNSLKSTGPTTLEGKAIVSMNSLTHGLRARRAVLPGENEEDFRRLCADLEANWRTQNRTEQLLLEDMAVSQWKVARMEAMENNILLKGTVNKQELALLAQLFQQQARLKRSFYKSMSELQRLQKNRPAAEDLPAQAASQATAAIGEHHPIAVPSPSRFVMSAVSADVPASTG